jgi:carboxyl-terminal processing protease
MPRHQSAYGPGPARPRRISDDKLYAAVSLAVWILLMAAAPVLEQRNRARAAELRRVARQQVSQELALATFDTAWTRVRDMHYDPLMNGVNWNALRDTLRPVAARSTSLAQLRDVMIQMLTRLGQSHFQIIPREMASVRDPAADDVGSVPGDAGVEFRLVDPSRVLRPSAEAGNNAQVLISTVDSGSPAWNAGVRAGWQLVSAGGVTGVGLSVVYV